MVGLKGAWEVRAGVLPGRSIPERSRSFYYTSDMYEEDMKRDGGRSHYMSLMEAAHRYAQQITHPSYVNWVTVTFTWC